MRHNTETTASASQAKRARPYSLITDKNEAATQTAAPATETADTLSSPTILQRRSLKLHLSRDISIQTKGVDSCEDATVDEPEKPRILNFDADYPFDYSAAFFRHIRVKHKSTQTLIINEDESKTAGSASAVPAPL